MTVSQCVERLHIMWKAKKAPAHWQRLARHAIGFVATMGLAACTSETTHYYTLRGETVPAMHSGQPASFLIDVLPVGIPTELDQPQLVIRQGDSMLVPLDTERWASSLDDEIRGALSSDLAKLLGTQDTAGLSHPAGQQLLRIKVQIRQFDAWPGQHVQLSAGWSIIPVDDTGKKPLTCFGQFDAKTSGDYLEMVQAQRRVIADMANQVAADTKNRAQLNTAQCSR